MSERQADAARRRWAGTPAAERRAHMRAAQAEAVRLRRLAALEGIAMAQRRDEDVLETAATEDFREAARLAGDRSVHAIAHELRRIYAARDVHPNTERGTHVHRHEEGAGRANVRPQEAQGHRPDEGNA